MANTTRKTAVSIHGTNPQFIIEKITRSKIYDSLYWKQHCFALTAELLVDKGMELKYVCGTYGGLRKPSPFICLILKMLQIQPSKQIIYEFIEQEHNKYIRVLGAFYLRLTGAALDIYHFLEPLLCDYRKVRQRKLDGSYIVTHVDELIDDMLRNDYLFQTALPHLTKRHVLELNEQIKPRVSALSKIDKDLKKNDLNGNTNQDSYDGDQTKKKRQKSRSKSRSRSRSSSRSESRSRSRSRSESDSESSSRSRSRSHSRSRSRENRKKRK